MQGSRGQEPEGPPLRHLLQPLEVLQLEPEGPGPEVPPTHPTWRRSSAATRPLEPEGPEGRTAPMGCPGHPRGAEQVQRPRDQQAEVEGQINQLEHWDLAQRPRVLEPEQLLLGPEGLVQDMRQAARAEVQA